ncbi:MAG: WGR domain-containing protein [Opitutaceae bacterium]|nr:WGR domain-containing protein [Opitutaceae bacterium]
MDAKSSKFWNIELDGSAHTVTYGRIGTSGQSSTKAFPSPEAAQKDFDKLVREKLAKGYSDAAAAGADASGIADSADGQIPLIAFSSITRRDDTRANAGTFVGKRVTDYDPEKPARTDVAYRFRSNWDEDNLIPNLTHFLATDAAPETTALILGSWHGDDSEKTSAEVIKTLVESKSRLAKLSASRRRHHQRRERDVLDQTERSIAPPGVLSPSSIPARARRGRAFILVSSSRFAARDNLGNRWHGRRRGPFNLHVGVAEARISGALAGNR